MTEVRRRRRVGTWIALGVAVLVVGALASVLSGVGRWSERDALDPESAGALGTRALAEILRDQGVEVVVARDRAAAERALTGGAASLVLPSAPALSDEAIEDLAADAADVVLVEPRGRDLRLLLAGTETGGYAPDETVSPACTLPDAERSGAIVPGALLVPGEGATACYPVGDAAALVVGEDDERRVSAVDGRALFANESLAENGNAALAVNLLGRHPVVVWYVPSLGDTDLADASPSLGALTPPWVSPAIVVLLAAGAAAAVWRGRRFGPLVAERLPVTVRGSETTEGRARLYARSRDAQHAADRLRIAALRRLARALALGPSASAQEIADAAAARTGIAPAAVRGILFDAPVPGDDELLDVRRNLHDLEDAVRAAVRPERNTR